MAPNIAVRPLHRARPMSRGRRVLATSSILLGLLIAGQRSGDVEAQRRGAPRLDTPVARPRPASNLRLNGDVDSNSPALWELVDGEPRLHVFTSTAGVTRRSEGSKVENLTLAEAVTWTIAPEQGVWMEAVVADDAGVWYGYYHNERRGIVCGKSRKVLPRIGAARSLDRGVTWEDLGTILEAPPGSHKCRTTNHYFHGGVGDLSVMLDPDREFLYIFYSEYLYDLSGQGVAAARMAWADRDAPRGRVDVWQSHVWMPPAEEVTTEDDETVTSNWIYPVGSPLFTTTRSWHDPEGVADAFWGPSVHWNSYLRQYVMLLNRTADVDFTQEGIYVSFNARLDTPDNWLSPRQVLAGGSWYPQIMGLEYGGSDKQAGQLARFFMSGSSSYLLEFVR